MMGMRRTVHVCQKLCGRLSWTTLIMLLCLLLLVHKHFSIKAAQQQQQQPQQHPRSHPAKYGPARGPIYPRSHQAKSSLPREPINPKFHRELSNRQQLKETIPKAPDAVIVLDDLDENEETDDKVKVEQERSLEDTDHVEVNVVDPVDNVGGGHKVVVHVYSDDLSDNEKVANKDGDSINDDHSDDDHNNIDDLKLNKDKRDADIQTNNVIDGQSNKDAESANKAEGTYTFKEENAIKWPARVNWQRTGDSIELYLFSAYYDDRPTIGNSHAVQVLSIAEEPKQGIPAQGDIYCHIWGQGKTPTLVIATRNLVGVENIKRPIKFHDKAFRSYVWSCIMDPKAKPPLFVSISIRTKIPTSFMPVTLPAKPSIKEDFAVCQRYFGQVDPYIVIEMMELYKILGVSKAIIYVTNLSPETSKVLLHYAQQGFMEVVDFPTPFEAFPRFPPIHKPNHIRILQAHSYNDCIYRNMYKYKYIIITDPDEIIIPQIHNNYKDMMNHIKAKEPSDKPKPYLFKNAFFFSHFPQNSNAPEKVTTLRYQTRLEPDNPFPAVIKVILDPMACVGFHVHRCWVHAQEAYHNWIVSQHIGFSYHYRKCHFELEEQGKCAKFLTEATIDTSMDRFKDQLIPAMQEQLYAIGLPSLEL